MEFTEFSLHENLLNGISKAGYVTCTPVQEQVLKGSLEGVDLYVQSQTGTGKTAAYLISIIQQLLTRSDVEGKKALIMVPTRELAVQVEQEAITLCTGTGLKVASFYGGVGYTKQTDSLKKNVSILVGTPGRVIDLQESGTMDLSEVAFLVVDEADRMFDMGFYPDLRTLIKVLPKTEDRQTMLFSATLNSYVKNLAWEYTRDAKEITIEADNITVNEIDQVLLHVGSDSKLKLLLGILKNEKPESVLIFCNTKKMCEIVSKRLKINGIESEFIIGDLPQSKRLQVLEEFKKGKLTCLVATDVAARGIDVNDLSMVINYDLPNEAENYVHRIGRTARAGKTGKAYTFCSEQDVYNLVPIERYIEMSIPSSMAFEDMMADDASAGMYIKTDDYGEDYDDRPQRRRDGGRDGRNNHSHDRNDNRRGNRDFHDGDRRNGHGKRDYNDNRNERGNRYEHGKRDFDKTNNFDKRSYKNDSHSDSRVQIDESKLATLSFDERMKLYKEKYSSQGSASSNPASASSAPKSKAPANSKPKFEKGKSKSEGYKNKSKDSKTKDFNKKPKTSNNAKPKNTKTNNSKPKAKPVEAKKGLNSLGLFGRIKLLFKK